MERSSRYLKSTDQKDVLGYGSYGLVTRSLDLQTQETVAIKEVIAERGISCSTLREIVLLGQLQRMNHPNVVKIKNVMTHQSEKAFCRELILDCAETDLNKYLKSMKGEMHIEQIKNFTAQILQGLSYCHSINIIHRDVKPSNILITNGILKLADFGLARAVTPSKDLLSPEVVTRCYRCPELLLGETRYSFGVDMWSVGCILAELTTKIPLFRGTNDLDQLHKIFRILGTPTEEYWPEYMLLKGEISVPNYEPKDLNCGFSRLGKNGLSLLVSLLQCNPNKRSKINHALIHKFLSTQISYVRALRKTQKKILKQNLNSMEVSSSSSSSSLANNSKSISTEVFSTEVFSPRVGVKRSNNTAIAESMNFKETLQVIKDSVLGCTTNTNVDSVIQSNEQTKHQSNLTINTEFDFIKPVNTITPSSSVGRCPDNSNLMIVQPSDSQSTTLSVSPRMTPNILKNNANLMIVQPSDSQSTTLSVSPRMTPNVVKSNTNLDSKDNNMIQIRQAFKPINYKNTLNSPNFDDNSDEDDPEILKSLQNLLTCNDHDQNDNEYCDLLSIRPRSDFSNITISGQHNPYRNGNNLTDIPNIAVARTLSRSLSQTSFNSYSFSSSDTQLRSSSSCTYGTYADEPFLSGRTDKDEISNVTLLDSCKKMSAVTPRSSNNCIYNHGKQHSAVSFASSSSCVSLPNLIDEHTGTVNISSSYTDTVQSPYHVSFSKNVETNYIHNDYSFDDLISTELSPVLPNSNYSSNTCSTKSMSHSINVLKTPDISHTDSSNSSNNNNNNNNSSHSMKTFLPSTPSDAASVKIRRVLSMNSLQVNVDHQHQHKRIKQFE